MQFNRQLILWAGALLVLAACTSAETGKSNRALHSVTVARANDSGQGVVNVFVDGRFRAALPSSSFVNVALCDQRSQMQLTSLASPVELRPEWAGRLKTVDRLDPNRRIEVRKQLNHHIDLAADPGAYALESLTQKKDLLPRGLVCGQ